MTKKKNNNTAHVAQWYLSNIKRRAKRKGIECNITLDDLEKQWVKQEGKCSLSGIKLDPTSDITDKETSDNLGSADRIDSNEGYSTDNIEWVHKRINQMKMNIENPQFIEMCKAVADKDILRKVDN